MDPPLDFDGPNTVQAQFAPLEPHVQDQIPAARLHHVNGVRLRRPFLLGVSEVPHLS